MISHLVITSKYVKAIRTILITWLVLQSVNITIIIIIYHCYEHED